MSPLDSLFFGQRGAQDSVRTELIRRTIHNSKESYLYKLPTELCDQIVQFLSPISAATLGITCQRFSRYLILTVRRVKHSKPEMFKILCMLEQETNIIPMTKAVCSGCLVLHPCYSFWPIQLQKDPEQRCCYRTVKRLVVLPDHLFSLRDIIGAKRRGCSIPGSITSFFREPDGRTTLTQRIKIMPISRKRELSKTEITTFLQEFDMPICPHLRFSQILEHFDTTHHRHFGCPRFGFRQQYRCSRCKTAVWFTKTTTLNLHVKRDLGHSTKDATLSSQAVLIKNQEKLQKYLSMQWTWRLLKEQISEDGNKHLHKARNLSSIHPIKKLERLSNKLQNMPELHTLYSPYRRIDPPLGVINHAWHAGWRTWRKYKKVLFLNHSSH